MSDFAEGQTATNPQTGAKVVWRSGSWHNATAADNTNTDTIVKALVDGRMSFPTDSRALNKPYWQNLMAKVSERDPTFDTIDYKARARTRQDFTSGKSAQNITSFNTLLHHIGTLQKAADELGNYGGLGTPLNAPANYMLEAGGSERPTNFRQAKLAVVSEAVRAFRGVGGARGDIEEAAAAIPENGSPEQIRGSIKTLASLLEGRIKSLGEQYSAGMGKSSNGINLLDADARKTLAQLGIGQAEDEDHAAGVANGGTGAAPSAGSSSTPPTFDGGSSELVRGDQMPQQVGTPIADYTPEQRAAIAAVARTGTGDTLKALLTSFGRAFTGTDQDLDKILAFYKDAKNAARAVNLPETNNAIRLNEAERKEVTDFVAGSDATGSGVAGVANGTSLSFLDEAGAVAEAAFGSGEGSFVDRYGRRLAVNRAKLGGLEEANPTAFIGGEILGSLPLGFGQFTGAQQAAKAAGLSAVRRGVPAAEARVLSNRVLAARNALEAAGLSGVYAAGDAEGGIGERLATGAMGAIVGGVVGGTTTMAGGRFARALAARRAARVAARPATTDAAMRNGTPATEAGQMLALAQQQGVRVLPQDIAEGPMIGRMTAGAAQSPFGTNTIRSATDDLYNSFSRRVGEVGGEAGTAPDVGGVVKARSAELAAREGQRAEATSGAVLREAGEAQDVTGAGIVVQRGATRWMEQTAERANALYARVPIQPEAVATLDGTRAALRELNEGMRSNPELGAIFSNPRLQALERAVTDDVDPNTGEITREARLSWRDLQEFRTRVGDAMDDPRLSEKIASRQLRRLYGALSGDMRATAEAQGPDALRAWRRANDYYDGRMKRVNQTLSAVLGERRDRTPSEAMNALNGMLREGSTGDAARFSRVLRSMEPADARIVRATIVQEARGGRRFNAKELANNWERVSERGKSALLPQAGLRSIMDDAADRAVASQRDPLAAKSGEQVVAALEAMAKSAGDSVAFRRQLAALSPDEAQSVRALLVNRMGLTKADAVRQGDGGEVFSISHFLSTWEKMTPDAKLALFGSGEMRGNMDALATLAKRVQGSEALRGHSNTGAVNSLNATTGGLGAAAVALVTGHPLVAAGLAAPAAYQRLSAEALTSQRLLNWLAKAPKKPNLGAQRAHIAALSSVARAEPAIANEVLALQQRLVEAFGGGIGGSPARLAAQEAANEPRREPAIADRQDRQGASANQRLQPR